MIPPLFRSSPYLLFSDGSSSRECAAAGLTHQRRRRCIGAIVGRHSLERSIQPAQHVRQSRCRGVLALLGGLLVRGVEEGGVASSAGVRAQSFRVPCGSDGLSFLRPVCVRCCSRRGSRLLRRCGHTCCLLAFVADAALSPSALSRSVCVVHYLSMRFVVCACTASSGGDGARGKNIGWLKRDYRALVTLVITFFTITQQLTGVKIIYEYGGTC